MRFVPARSEREEIIDRPDHSAHDLERTLRDIRATNRWLGGRRALLRALRPLFAGADPARPLAVLDVGTGSGDLPLAMVRLARNLGRQVVITAIDRDPVTAAIARRETAGTDEVRVLATDALALPFRPGSFDIVTASMFLHHFRESELVRLLSAFRRLARRAVVINDLRRHLLPWFVIRLLAHATGRHPFFVHDAPLSVLRGFTDAELSAAAAACGAADGRLERRWPFRLILTLPGAGL
jgi:SAM-dependent methyltransferase